MNDQDDRNSTTDKVEEFVNNIKREGRDAETDIKDVQENVVESRINDIQDDPEFRLWQNRLEKKVPQRQDDNPDGETRPGKED